MRMGPTLVGLSLAAALFSAAARADGLSVSPTGLNLGSGDKVASLTVNSAGSVPTAGQVRVFRWLQKNGSESLIPTRDVVASPPAMRLAPGKSMTVRVVRMSKAPVAAEECYRILVDQLPGAEQDASAVKFTIRHSVPLCFDAPRQKQLPLVWSVQRQGDAVVVLGSNGGERRVVARDVKISTPAGASASLGVATVLGGSTMSWPLPAKLKGLKPGSTFILTAVVDGKTVEARGEVGGG